MQNRGEGPGEPGSGAAGLSRFLAWTPWIGLLWGFGEGTVFFIVPDVLISLVALFSWRRSLVCTGTALLGSLLGGR